MAKNVDILWDKMQPESRRRVEDRVEATLLSMALQDLRKGRQLTQKDLAGHLGVNQPALSKMERQEDMNISTLRRIIQGMGGTLKLIAEFPEEDVIINQFERQKKRTSRRRTS